MSRLPMISGASKMVFDPSRCNQSSTSTSTVRRGGLSTKKAGNQRLLNEIPKQPNNSLKTGRNRHQRAIGDNGSTLAANDPQEPLGTMALHWLYTGRRRSSGIDPRIRLGRLGLLLLGLFLLPPRLLGLIALELLFELLKLLVLFLSTQFDRLGRPFDRFVELT